MSRYDAPINHHAMYKCGTEAAANQRLSHRSSVVDDSEVGLRLALLGRLRLDEAGRLAQVVVLQLLLEGLVGGLGEHALLFEDREHAHRLPHTGEMS